VRKRSWVWRLAAVVAALALALGLAACGDDNDSGAASDTSGGASETVNVAYVTTAQHPYGIAVDAFAKDVNATGALTIAGQPSYAQSEIQLLDDVQSGAVKMATVSTAVWDTAGTTAFQALQAPFLITNYGLEGAVIDGDIGKSMIASANQEAPDQVALAIHEGGLRKPFAVKPLVSLADWKGKTIRAPQSKVLAAGIAALGANADPLPLPDVNQALQNGTVDGMEANFGLVVTQKLYEDAKNFTANVNLWPFPTVLTANKAWYDSLTADQQAAITGAAAKIGAASLAIFTQPSTFPQDLVNCGVKFNIATPQQQTQLSQAGSTATSALAPESQDFVTQIQQLKESMPPPAAPPPLPTETTGACGSTG
jgi:TRAP-type C4-dicarboxylate transport system substrate-binding protein